MNSLVEKGYVTEMVCGSNFAYVLSDSSSFLATEYKVLQSQTDSGFVKCMKMLFNGKIQLYYLTESLRPFAAMLPTLDPDSFIAIASNLLADIVDVKHNGFLSCQNIDISFDKIYIDPSTYKVKLVYLPLNRHMYDDDSIFENEIRTSLVKVIADTAAIAAPKTSQFAADLSNGMLSIDDLCSWAKKGKSAALEPPYMPSAEVKRDCISLVAINAPSRVEVKITKDSFVIGKNESVDGVVNFNEAISRVHCRIDRHGGHYTITDLKSANGTYVNKVKLQPNQPHPISSGDIVRLANSDFRVSNA